jgi:glycosyltransferase involved in cell wall biosynthesis
VPLVSVVTVVKDDPRGLAATLTSLGSGDRAGTEVVVIDGSADRSAATAAEQAGARYTWCEPRGVYPAMNDGLTAATGEYVYFLNAGDTLVDPGVLPRIVTLLEEHRPRWALGRVRFVGVDGRPMVEPPWDYAAERDRSFARGRFPAHQAVVMSREGLLADGGFDISYRVAADYAAVLRFSLRSDPLPLGLVLAEFHAGGLSTVAWRQAQREFHRARREVLRPRGGAALLERWDTAVHATATAAYRGLWAPGRPLHGLVRSRA